MVVFRHTVYIGKAAVEVWKAITQKSLVDQYFMVPLLSLDLHPGGEISYGLDRPSISGRIVEFHEPTKLVHTFRFCESNEPATTVIYRIESVGDDMCAVHLTHDGFADQSKNFADITTGWPIILSSLKTMLETGTKLPWPK